MSHELTTSADGQIAEIVLSGPSGNSLDREGILALCRTLDELAAEEALRVIVLTGSNGTFCGGRLRDPRLVTAAEIGTDLEPIVALNERIEATPVPLVAAVEGAALGFGFGLAVLCDYTVATEDCRFALTELAHGIPPLIVLSYLSRFVPYKVAFDLALTGRDVTGAEAVRLGLVTELCSVGAARDRARALATDVAALPPRAVRLLRSYGRQSAALVDSPRARAGVDLIASLLAGDVDAARAPDARDAR